MDKFRKDVAYQELKTRLSDLQSLTKEENESTTRLRAIDTILVDILNWDKNQIETEKYCRQEGYADYVFYINSNPSLVLEAKKSGTSFILTDKIFENRPYIFGLFSKECPNAAKAFQQAIGYASTLGARYVAISNGHQWIFSLTFVPNQNIEKRLVYIFESFDALLSKFSLFCDCFSQEGLHLNLVNKYLLDTVRQPAPAKLSSKISGYPLAATRNVYQNEITYILDYVWETMAQDEGTIDFVKDCYVNPLSHGDIISLAKELIEKRKNEDDIIREYTVKGVDKLPHEIAHLPSEKPFVILGEVGRGKSSFLKYLRFVAAEEVFKKYIQIDINFLDRPDSAEDIPNFIYGEIERQLKTTYEIDITKNNTVRGVLDRDIQRLKETPKGVYYSKNQEEYNKFELEEIDKITSDKHNYFTKVIQHLKNGQLYSIVLFFDNLDRRNLDIQENALLKASAIARDWASLVFICLRPSTYYASQQGRLDVLAPITFTVGHPELPVVLKKRFEYAMKIAEGDLFDRNLIKSAPSKNVSLNLPKISKIFESCEFAAMKRHGIIPMLEDISNGNIRRLLDFAREILSSGHLDTEKIITKIEESGKYYIPDFEGVKALIFGDYKHYNSSKSPFINLFDIQNNNPLEHFLRLAILNYLLKIPLDGTSHGYAKTADIFNYLSMIGYSYEVAEDNISYLIKQFCIKRPIDGYIDPDGVDKVRITSLGRYHIISLVSFFQYLDAIIIDTPLLDSSLYDICSENNDILNRLNRTEKFISYLDSCSNHIQDEELKSFWIRIRNSAIEDITAIRTDQLNRPSKINHFKKFPFFKSILMLSSFVKTYFFILIKNA